MIYYIYRINFLKGFPEGRYYLGMRSFGGDDVNKDKYCGSGYFCKEYFSIYDPIVNETYTKDILEYNNSFESNRLREIDVIGDKWKTDPLCMNMSPGGTGGEDCQPKSVIQYDLYGNEIARFSSQVKASEAMNLQCSSGISKACLVKTTTCSGYIWRFEEEPLTLEELCLVNPHSKPVIQYDTLGNFIKLWDSATEAGLYLNIDRSSILNICNHCNPNRHTAGGYVWSYYNKDFILNKTNHYNYKQKINKYNLNGDFIDTYDSFAEAAKSENTFWQNIQACCNRQQARVGNFIYRFLEDYITEEDLVIAKKTMKKPIYKFNKDKQLVKIFFRLKDAADDTDVAYQAIQAAIKKKCKCKGYYWSYDKNFK